MSQATVARWFVFGLVLAVSAAQVLAQTSPPLARVGTLTCVTSETPPAATADAELLCDFHATSGRDTKFKGYITRRGQADLPAGKRVLVWSVQATTPEIEPGSIAGKYGGQTGGRSSGRLIGGRSGSILLTPLDRTASSGGTVLTTLELRIVPYRA